MTKILIDEATVKLALEMIKAARYCPPNAVDTLLFEAEEILEEALAAQQEHLPNDLQLAIESMIETYKAGDLDGWEVQLVKRGLRICAHNIKENT